MPCQLSQWEREEEERKAREKLVEHVDKLTSLLCATCSELVEVHNVYELPRTHAIRNAEVRKWWEAHKKEDRRRKQSARKSKSK